MLSFLFDYDSPELHELSRSLRKFSADHFFGPESRAYCREDFEAMAALGLSSLGCEQTENSETVFGHLATATAVFELARGQLGPAVYLSVHLMVLKLLSKWDSEASHTETISALQSGKSLGAFCLTEAGAGSDAAALSTKAEKKGEDYILNGEKIYITSGGVADTYLVFARTGEAGPKGISAFVLPRQTAGLSFGKPERKMGCHGAPITSVVFSNCKVPQSSRLGHEGEGFKIALSGLTGGRVNIGAAACGLAARAIELAREHLKTRKQFDTALSEFQGLQFMLADMLIGLQTSILATRHAASLLDAASAQRAPASVAKCHASDTAMKISTDAVQLLGGAGYLEEYIVERIMRDAKMLQIVEGTNQIQRSIIARELLS